MRPCGQQFHPAGGHEKRAAAQLYPAAKPPLSVEAYHLFVECVRGYGLARVETGEFGADMQIALVNDGPVTLVLDTEEWKRG